MILMPDPPFLFNHIGRFLAYHINCRVHVSRSYSRHYGSIHHSQSPYTVHSQLWIDHSVGIASRSHLNRAHLVIHHGWQVSYGASPIIVASKFEYPATRYNPTMQRALVSLKYLRIRYVYSDFDPFQDNFHVERIREEVWLQSGRIERVLGFQTDPSNALRELHYRPYSPRLVVPQRFEHCLVHVLPHTHRFAQNSTVRVQTGRDKQQLKVRSVVVRVLGSDERYRLRPTDR